MLLRRLAMVAKRMPRAARLSLVLALVAGGAAVGSAAVFGGSSPTKPVEVRTVVGGPAPSFRLASVDHGPWVTLPALGRQPVIVNFFASWCEGCQMEMGNLNRLAKAAADHVQVIGIDLNDDPSQVRALLAQNHITYPVGLDDGAQVAAGYQLVGLPTTVYINGQHMIVGRTVGPLSQSVGQAWLNALEGGSR
jgi:cytochrome c biogenesis protein CcmG/thiol:disulfide interchange protein DsbE